MWGEKMLRVRPVFSRFDRWPIFLVSIHHYDNVFSILKLCWTQTSPSQLSAQERHKTNMFVSILVFIVQIYLTFLFLYIEIILLNWNSIRSPIISAFIEYNPRGSIFVFQYIRLYYKLGRDDVFKYSFSWTCVGDKKSFPNIGQPFKFGTRKTVISHH